MSPDGPEPMTSASILPSKRARYFFSLNPSLQMSGVMGVAHLSHFHPWQVADP